MDSVKLDTGKPDRCDRGVKASRVAGVIVFIAALLIQLQSIPGYTPDYDQAHVLSVGRDFVEHGVFPDHGSRNSLRAFNPPIFPWLFIPPMMFTSNVSVILIFPALLLHSLALFALYRTASTYFHPTAGVLSITLYAFSIQGLYFGHSSWQQGLLAPLYTLLLSCFFRWLLDDRPSYSAVALFLCSVITGVHWGGILTFGVFGILAGLNRRNLQPIRLVVGGFLAALIWLPYLRFENGRGYANIKAFLRQTPIAAPAPSEVTSLCPPEDQQGTDAPGLKGKLKKSLAESAILYEAARRFYHILQGIPGAVRALYVNFHWDPHKGSKGPLPYLLMFVMQAGVFLLALAWLGLKILWRKESKPSERLLVLVFALPAVLQNLSGYWTSSLKRPDVSWMFYGPQMMIIAHGLTATRFGRTGWVRLGVPLLLAVWVGWILFTTIPATAMRVAKGEPSPRMLVADSIADDLATEGRREASIRYDFLPENPEWCWVVSFGALDSRYSLGAAFDYLLESVHGVRNTHPTPDGMAPDPDYVVVYPAGLKRNLASGTKGRQLTPDNASIQVVKIQR